MAWGTCSVRILRPVGLLAAVALGQAAEGRPAWASEAACEERLSSDDRAALASIRKKIRKTRKAIEKLDGKIADSRRRLAKYRDEVVPAHLSELDGWVEGARDARADALMGGLLLTMRVAATSARELAHKRLSMDGKKVARLRDEIVAEFFDRRAFVRAVAEYALVRKRMTDVRTLHSLAGAVMEMSERLSHVHLAVAIEKEDSAYQRWMLALSHVVQEILEYPPVRRLAPKAAPLFEAGLVVESWWFFAASAWFGAEMADSFDGVASLEAVRFMKGAERVGSLGLLHRSRVLELRDLRATLAADQADCGTIAARAGACTVSCEPSRAGGLPMPALDRAEAARGADVATRKAAYDVSGIRIAPASGSSDKPRADKPKAPHPPIKHKRPCYDGSCP